VAPFKVTAQCMNVCIVATRSHMILCSKLLAQITALQISQPHCYLIFGYVKVI